MSGIDAFHDYGSSGLAAVGRGYGCRFLLCADRLLFKLRSWARQMSCRIRLRRTGLAVDRVALRQQLHGGADQWQEYSLQSHRLQMSGLQTANMTDNDLKIVIRGMIKQDTGLRVPLSTLGDNANLFDSGMNSLGTVMLIMSLEGKYGFDFPEELLNRESFKSIDAIAESVQSVLSKSAKSA